MQRNILDAEHLQFAESVREFVSREVTPHYERWEKAGCVDRSVWTAAGRQGLLGFELDEKYGGAGLRDFRFNAVMGEELVRGGAPSVGMGFGLQNDIVLPYLTALLDDEQKGRWLPGVASGEIVTAIAMTEPGTGSDLQGIRTRAVPDGDGWRLSGQKTFITNGILADLVLVVARTDPEAGAKGISLLAVERGMPGFERGRNLDKIGLKAQDTAELFFDDVPVPRENLVGEEGMGFVYLMQNLPQERLTVAVVAVAAMERCLADTVAYCREREAFGRSIGRFQHVRFELAEMATEVEIARVYVDRCITEHNAGALSAVDAAMAKWWTTELQQRVVNRCLQLFGGYGYMLEYPIAKAYLDSRVQTIYAGTNEIMKEIIGRSLEL